MDQRSPELSQAFPASSLSTTLASLAALEKSYKQGYQGSERINRPNRQPSKLSNRLLFALGILPVAMAIATYVNHPTKADYTPPQPIVASVAVTEMPANQVALIAPVETQIQTKSQENLADQTLAGLAPNDRKTVNATIIKQAEIYGTDKERIRNTLSWKTTVKSAVEDKRLGVNDKDKAQRDVMDIIFVESGGDPKASSGIAFGLTQLKPSTAKEAAQKIGVSKFDILNGYDNVILGTVHQQNLAERYGDLATWTHHLGSGNMDTALRTYFIQDLRLPIKDVDQIFNSSKDLLYNIKKYKITSFLLLFSPAVTGKLKEIGAFEDQTDQYPVRLIAADLVMNPN